MEFSFEKLIKNQIEAITELGSSAFQNGYDAGFQAGYWFRSAELKAEEVKMKQSVGWNPEHKAYQEGYRAGFQTKEREIKVEADKKKEGIDELVARRKHLGVGGEGYGGGYNQALEELGDDIKEYLKK